MSPARILIVSNGHLCRNPRVLKEADTLGRAGHAVTVLTVRNHAASEQQDLALLAGAPFTRACVDMLPAGSSERGRVFLRRLQLWAARQAATRLRRPTLGALGPTSALLRRARAFPADLTIVHNEVPHWVGTRLRRAGRRVAADIEDWHSEDLLPGDRAQRPLAQIRAVERSLLNDLAYTTTTSEAMASALHACYGGRRPHVITNSFPLQPAPRTAPPGEPPAFLWFSQTLGPGRGLEGFLDAWGATQAPSRVVFVGDARPDYVQALRQRVPAGRRAALAFRGLVPPAALPALIAEHDIGLALEPSSPPNKDLTISNKVLQYLNAGLAVVATPTAGQREVLGRDDDAGIVLAFGDTAAAAAQLEALLHDRDALARRQRAARALAERRYCWEHEAPRLVALVEDALR